MRTKRKEMGNKSDSKDNATTYFGCTAALGDSCGAPSHAVLPSDALPASSVPLHSGDSGNVGQRKSLGRCRQGASVNHRSR